MGATLDGLGQIPVRRGQGDAAAIESRLDAVQELVERPSDLYQPIKVRVTNGAASLGY